MPVSSDGDAFSSSTCTALALYSLIGVARVEHGCTGPTGSGGSYHEINCQGFRERGREKKGSKRVRTGISPLSIRPVPIQKRLNVDYLRLWWPISAGVLSPPIQKLSSWHPFSNVFKFNAAFALQMHRRLCSLKVKDFLLTRKTHA